MHTALAWVKKHRASIHAKAAFAIGVGALLGSLCEYAPEAFQAQCHLAAKIISGIGKLLSFGG